MTKVITVNGQRYRAVVQGETTKHGVLYSINHPGAFTPIEEKSKHPIACPTKCPV